MESQQERFDSIDEMTACLVYEGGESFGELSLINNQTRGGTIVTLTDCHFAIVTRDAFEKLIKKDKLI